MRGILKEVRSLRFGIIPTLVILMLAGCASTRESVQWEFKSEKLELEPHEQRRADADYLADPDHK